MMFSAPLRDQGPVSSSSSFKSRRQVFQDLTNTAKTKAKSKATGGISLKPSKDHPAIQVQVDRNDALCKSDYIHEMYNHFSTRESSTSVRPLYMEDQTQLNELMRAMLVDWLVDVCNTFRLTMATLFLTINLIDRFLEISPGVSRKEFQLLGVTALWIASKYEEIRPMEIHQLVDVCDSCYTKRQIFQKETELLHGLHFNLSIPTSLTFLLRFLKAANANRQMAHMAMYILESTLGSYNLLHYLPSQMAAASVYLSRRSLVVRPAWTEALTEFTGYDKDAIIPVAKAIFTNSESSTTSLKLVAVKKKYSSKHYSSVANTAIRAV